MRQSTIRDLDFLSFSVFVQNLFLLPILTIIRSRSNLPVWWRSPFLLRLIRRRRRRRRRRVKSKYPYYYLFRKCHLCVCNFKNAFVWFCFFSSGFSLYLSIFTVICVCAFSVFVWGGVCVSFVCFKLHEPYQLCCVARGYLLDLCRRLIYFQRDTMVLFLWIEVKNVYINEWISNIFFCEIPSLFVLLSHMQN